MVVEKRGTTIGGGAGLDKANVEVTTVSGDGTVDMTVSAEGLVGIRAASLHQADATLKRERGRKRELENLTL